MRAGYAYAQGANIHGAPPERHWVAETRRAFVWAGLIPIIILVAAAIDVKCLALFAVYPLQILRMTARSRFPFKKAVKHAFFLVLGKFPELIGGLKFFWHRFCKNQGELIEYK